MSFNYQHLVFFYKSEKQNSMMQEKKIVFFLKANATLSAISSSISCKVQIKNF